MTAKRERRSWAAACLAIGLIALPVTASGQGSGLITIQPAPGPALTEVKPLPGGATTVPGGSPPFDAQLLRLSEILGALHYLRQLCGSGEGSLWRDQMQGLIDAENPDAARKARFIDRFNRGYDSFRAVYRSCTEAATAAIDRYMGEGETIARDVVARYGHEK
jgi:uncharacterized protein (TIGR02301 family)